MGNRYVREGATYNGDGLTSGLATGSNVTFTIASPGKVNWTAHGLSANALVYFGVTTAGVLPTGITAGTTYYVRNPGTNDFEVSATSGGASINFSGTPSGTANCTTTGAWNHANILTGTVTNAITGGTSGSLYTPTAGDIVYIRSLTEASANISFSLNSANAAIGRSNSSTNNPLIWVLDGGTVWSGVNGTLSFAHTSGTTLRTVTLKTNNWLIAENEDKIEMTSVGGIVNTAPVLILEGRSIVQHFKFDWSANKNVGTPTDASNVSLNSVNAGRIRFIRCKFRFGGFDPCAFLTSVTSAQPDFVGCDIELTDPQETASLHAPNYSVADSLRLFGGRLFGDQVTTAWSVQSGTSDNQPLTVGTLIPAGVPLVTPSSMTQANHSMASFDGDGKGGADFWDWTGMVSSRSDNNPPTLNATLPDSAGTKFSYRLRPSGITSGTFNWEKIPNITMSKFYQNTEDEQVITLEFLVSSTVTGVTKRNVWIDVSYIDHTTGLPKVMTTQDLIGTAALDSSSVTWTPENAGVPYWGAATYSKKKLAVTTPTKVKKDTMIHVRFHAIFVSTSSNQDMFVCPDIQLAAA